VAGEPRAEPAGLQADRLLQGTPAAEQMIDRRGGDAGGGEVLLEGDALAVHLHRLEQLVAELLVGGDGGRVFLAAGGQPDRLPQAAPVAEQPADGGDRDAGLADELVEGDPLAAAGDEVLEGPAEFVPAVAGRRGRGVRGVRGVVAARLELGRTGWVWRTGWM